jgi:hypothetical protein
MNLTIEKTEIIKWISSVEDPQIIEQINNYRKQKSFDFKEELKGAITGKELKKRTTKFISSLEWKK